MIDKKELPKSIKISREEALEMYQQMNTIRSMENKANSLYKNRKIRGFCHLAVGQEACNVGLENSIRKDDIIAQSYRMHGLAYTRGIPVRDILAELCFKKSGASQGKGGSMHFYKENIYGGYGIVGSQVPIGAGIAFACKYLKSDKISVALYGDGAANQGQIYEAFNMAKLYNCPVIFICENNQFAMGTSIERSSGAHEFYNRGQYIPGIKIDGQDLPSVLAGTRYAAEWCRNGNGPIVLEYETYRFFGHSMSDPGLSYRTRDEIKEKRQHSDPIQIFKHKIIDSKLVPESDLADIETECLREIDDIEKQLENEAEPSEEIFDKDIYVDYTGDLKNVRGRDPSEIYTR